MARRAKYTQALPVYVTPEVRARILKIADENQISQAEVVRDLINEGLEKESAIALRRAVGLEGRQAPLCERCGSEDAIPGEEHGLCAYCLTIVRLDHGITS